MQVLKRNGNLEEFDVMKIKSAIRKAFEACEYSIDDEVLDTIAYSVDIWEDMDIEDIQDQIEEILMDFDYPVVAKAFMVYREKRKALRQFIQERSDYIDKCAESSENTATLSEVDSNANVQNKNVATIEAESFKGKFAEVQRYRMEKILKRMYPEVAHMYVKDILSREIYVHDEASSSVPKPYCVAVSMYPFFNKGTSSLDGLRTKAPQNIDSFCGQFANLVFLLSSQFKGAVAFGEFFNAIYYYCVKEWGEDFWKYENDIVNCRSIKPKTMSDAIEQMFQGIVCSINQPAGNRSFQSPFTNISYYDSNYWHSLFDDFYFPDGTQPKWEGVDYLQKKFMRWFNKYRTEVLLTFPVESMSLLTDGNDIIDKDYKDFTAEMYANGHSFFTYMSDSPDALASCCRLRNAIDKNVFSFTSGLTGVATGSVNVITLNLNRIIQNYIRKTIGLAVPGVRLSKSRYPELANYIKELLERVYKYHIAYKTQLYNFEKAGILPVYSAGYISLDKQFSTIGLNGINEAAEFIGLTCSNNEDYREFCDLITTTIETSNTEHSTKKFRFNLEFVPAEGLGIKNYNWDKEDGYWVPEDRNCYNSYFYKPDDSSISVLEKFQMHGKEFTKNLSGGVALHCNLEEHLSKEQYTKLLEYAVKQGTSYFTFNIPNSECSNCGFITKHPIHKCPECGSEKITWWTRIIGYLRPITAFSKGRQEEASRRIYSTITKEM